MVVLGQAKAWPRLDLRKREKRRTLREEKVRPASTAGGPRRLPIVAMTIFSETLTLLQNLPFAMKYYPNERYGCCQEEMGSSGVLNPKVTAFMEEKVKVPTPGEAGYAIQLSNETPLDVHSSNEHKMVDRHGFKAQPSRRITTFVMGSYDLSEKVLNLLNFLELTGASNFLGGSSQSKLWRS
ncbi:hypothetical protein CMV_004021 [Castanea mollissima]|uniref:Uncharacterized protein n=1 Tax=Castanea mollissima TaxID=60419 RepID=A0A8J4RGC3_9ROSI|nr:hypothetical protein CMV_004021 [Castanea mollissima]